MGDEKQISERYGECSQQLYTRYRHNNGLVKKINQIESHVSGLLDILVGLAWIIDFRSWDLVFCAGILHPFLNLFLNYRMTPDDPICHHTLGAHTPTISPCS